ncbi:MAG: response regulator transcription factor [Acidobacteria bacterium]|nr:response regulator transcription factor [Acidobacteriota bacterium]
MIHIGLEAPEEERSRLELMLTPRFAVTPYSHMDDEEKPDLVVMLLDRVPESIRAEMLALPLLVLMDSPPPAFTPLALRWGVRGVLPADADETELEAAVEAVAAGLLVVHPNTADALTDAQLDAPARPATPLQEPLTPRETEILRMLALGIGNKEIAARLAISEHTVKYHVASILSKMGAGTRTEAVTAGLRYGLILL